MVFLLRVLESNSDLLTLTMESKAYRAIGLAGTDRQMNNLIPTVSADVANTHASI